MGRGDRRSQVLRKMLQIACEVSPLIVTWERVPTETLTAAELALASSDERAVVVDCASTTIGLTALLLTASVWRSIASTTSEVCAAGGLS